MEVLVDFLLSLYGPTPYLVILGILLLCGIGAPIPEDITLFAAGLLSYYGVTNVWGITALSLFGVLAGDITIFHLGKRYGRELTRRWFFKRLLSEQKLDAVGERLARQGNSLIFAARFMPGLRAPIFFTAGTLKLPLRIFLLYDGGAALLSVPAIVGAVYYFGDELEHVIRVIKGIEHGIVVAVLAIALFLVAKWYVGKRRLSRG